MVGKKRDGFYVDVGCYHPKRFSNTYWLHRRGWRGINIDMEKHKIEMFRLARPHDVNVVAAISDKNENSGFQKRGTTISKPALSKWEQRPPARK